MSESIKGVLEINLHSELYTGNLVSTVHVNAIGLVVDAELLADKANKAMHTLIKQPEE